MNIKKLIGNYDETKTAELSIVDMLTHRHDLFSARQIEKLDIVLEIVTEYLHYKSDDEQHDTPERIFNAVIENYIKHDITREHFGVVFFDNKMHIIRSEILFSGTRDTTVVEFSTILKKAILLNAVSIALIHNHPAGNTEPSREDLDLTHRLETACQSIGIRLIDHLIIGGVSLFESLRRSGYL